MIDSHCHLDHLLINEQLNEILNRAKLNGVKFLLTISTNLKSFEVVKSIISNHANIYGTLGIHPHEAKDHINVDKKTLLDLTSIMIDGLLYSLLISSVRSII